MTTTTGEVLSRVRARLNEAKERDESSSSADVLASSQACLADLRGTLNEMNQRAAERERTITASEQLERRWAEFQDRFGRMLNKLAENVGKAMEKEGSTSMFQKALGNGEEQWDRKEDVDRKVHQLADMCRAAKATGGIVVFTGAGVSTSSGIPDYRSPLSS